MTFLIAYQLQEIGLAVSKNGLVPPPKDMPHTSVMPIEALGIDPVQLAHTPGESTIENLNKMTK